MAAVMDFAPSWRPRRGAVEKATGLAPPQGRAPPARSLSAVQSIAFQRLRGLMPRINYTYKNWNAGQLLDGKCKQKPQSISPAVGLRNGQMGSGALAATSQGCGVLTMEICLRLTTNEYVVALETFAVFVPRRLGTQQHKISLRRKHIRRACPSADT